MITHTWDAETVALRDKKTRSPGFFKPPVNIDEDSHIAPAPVPEKSISARVFPNGEFGVGFVPPRGISAKERRYDADCRYAEQNVEIVADIEIGSQYPEGFIYTRKIIPGSPPPKLGIGSESSQPSVRYGLKGITSYGRKMLRNAGHVLDVACKGRYNRKLSMGTVTVPSYNPESMTNICRRWGDIQRRFFQECRRRYERFRYRFDYASATEIQPQRLENSGEVGLHIHFLFVAIRYGRGKWCLPHSWVRETWQRILESYLVNDKGGQLPNYRYDVVSSSGAAYIAKYVSKGGGDIERVVQEHGEECVPRQWWSVSSVVRKCIHAHTIRSCGTVAEKLLVLSRWGESEYMKYVRCITLTVPSNDYSKACNCPSEIVLGYGGLLTALGYQLFAPTNQCESIRESLSRTLGCNTYYWKKYSKHA